MKKIILLFIMILLANFQAKAQFGGLGGISYSTGHPIWDTRDFINNLSWRGISIDYKHFQSKSFSWGAHVGWNSFAQRIDDVLVFEQGAISGTQVRKLGAIPILVNINYFATSLYSSVCPYLALNVGTYYMRETISLGIYGSNKGVWHIALSPEIGTYIPIGDMYLQFALKLNNALKAGSYLGDEKKELSWISLNIGASLPLF